MIPQELAVVPGMTVAENMFRNREPGRLGFVDGPAMIAHAGAILRELDLDIDPELPIGRLGIAQQQLTEIAKALSRRARVLILDEPTASITQAEADRLFLRLRALRDAGCLCLYISHRIDEVTALADRVIVLRDGTLAADRAIAGVGHAELVGLMLGRAVSEVYPERAAKVTDRELLRVEGLTVRDPRVPGRLLVEDAHLALRTGEIVGIFGLVGAGRTELVTTLFGASPGPVSGRILVEGSELLPRSPRDAIAVGLALVTEDRFGQGFIPEFGVARNITLAALSTLASRGTIDAEREERTGARIAADLRVRARSLDQAVRTLSGGNQQKVVLGKWLATAPRVLLLDEPTRGIDVGAKVDLYHVLADLAASGLGVLFVSSEVEEVRGLADRVLVMYRGRIVAELPASASEEELLRLATGASGAPGAAA
jgi:D-xylose transport system ATP-binding protein